ncbi:hypothetical protein [Mesorhizobium marinum]|uniref:hypothetical protein n=1 Tax=Mesorhizobium marinum TaxID=3228790 RepID=UPI003465C19F
MGRSSGDSVRPASAGTDEAKAAAPRGSDIGQGMSPEMRRQMEAAKERMKRYHAVYGQKPPESEPG